MLHYDRFQKAYGNHSCLLLKIGIYTAHHSETSSDLSFYPNFIQPPPSFYHDIQVAAYSN